MGGVIPEPGAVAGGVTTSGACSGDPRAANLAFSGTISAPFSLYHTEPVAHSSYAIYT